MRELTGIELKTTRVVLEPLRVDHATEMVAVLAPDQLYKFTGGEGPAPADLVRRYTAQVAGSGDPDELWLNWIVRLRDTNTAIGFVQATVEAAASDVAWTIGVEWQGNGYATESAAAMVDWLSASGAPPPQAWIHPAHVASQKIAQSLGLVLTDEVDDDGEQRWGAS